MHARRRDGLRKRQMEIVPVAQHLEYPRRDAGPAEGADHDGHPPVLGQDRRGHGRQRPLAGRDRVGVAADDAVDVRGSWLGGEVVHLVVE